MSIRWAACGVVRDVVCEIVRLFGMCDVECEMDAMSGVEMRVGCDVSRDVI